MNRISDSKIYLQAIATAVPEHRYGQEFARDFFLGLQGDTPRKKDFLNKVYANTGIENRYTVIDDYGKDPLEYTFYPQNKELLPEPTSKKRNDLFKDASNGLSLAVATKLLDQLPNVKPDQITHLVTVSCTGFSVPGFDLHLQKLLGLSKTLERYHVGFMGCYAAFPAMRMARDICLAHGDAKVLLVAVELCSLHFQQKFDPETVIANAIFADGSAAALISADPRDSDKPKLELQNFSSQIIENSERDMAWILGDHGFNMRLSLYVPQLVRQNIRGVITELLKDTNCTANDIDGWAIHPGGRAILDKVAKELELTESDMSPSRGVLREYGNMSSPSILFVLQKLMSNNNPGRVFAVAFGPGLTVESGLMEMDLEA